MSEQFVEGSASSWDAPVAIIKNRVTVAAIGRIVAEYYGVPWRVFISKRRDWPLVRHRQLAMYLAHKLTPASFPQIGRIFGGRDHTTAMHAIKVIPGYMAIDQQMQDDFDALTQTIADWSGRDRAVMVKGDEA